MHSSISLLFAAGSVTEDDGKFMPLQNLTLAQAETVAIWLAVATNGPVKIEYVSYEGHVTIEKRPEDVVWNGPTELP